MPRQAFCRGLKLLRRSINAERLHQNFRFDAAASGFVPSDDA